MNIGDRVAIQSEMSGYHGKRGVIEDICTLPGLLLPFKVRLDDLTRSTYFMKSELIPDLSVPASQTPADITSLVDRCEQTFGPLNSPKGTFDEDQ